VVAGPRVRRSLYQNIPPGIAFRANPGTATNRTETAVSLWRCCHGTKPTWPAWLILSVPEGKAEVSVERAEVR
jgi:hypothetical protein